MKQGWLVPLDDLVDEELRADIDESIWRQNSIDGHVYTMPFHQLQNTLMVNRTMMERAGLEAYIPKTIPWPTGPRRNLTDLPRPGRSL